MALSVDVSAAVTISLGSVRAGAVEVGVVPHAVTRKATAASVSRAFIGRRIMRLLGSVGRVRVVRGTPGHRVAVTLATCQTPPRAGGYVAGGTGGGAVGAHSCGAGGGAD